MSRRYVWRRGISNMARALSIYQSITRLSSPLIRLYLKWRQLKGKEDPARILERFGHASCTRPEGVVWWLHASSVGEAMSLRPLVEHIHQAAPDIQILLTSGTVSSATLLGETLPDYVIHQYVPVDTPAACARFLDHWQPTLGLFTESELWPNLIVEATKRRVILALINARMSERSARQWQMLTDMARSLLTSFSLIAAQTAEDADRYTALGGRDIRQLGHLKQDAEALAVDEAALASWQRMLQGRPCLVAASFHPGEDELLVELHQALKRDMPNLLTLLVPRHPPRGAGMAQTFKALNIKPQLRSKEPALHDDVECYIADTIGELGLWYRLADVAVMGGSFISHGGQNPLEAVRLDTPVIIGPSVHNFQVIVDELTAAGGIKHVTDSGLDTLLATTKHLLADQTQRADLAKRASDWLAHSPPVAKQLTDALLALTKEDT